MGEEDWWHLRPTPTGLVVLGEWPDLERTATAVSIHGILRRLGETATADERGPLLRTAGYAGGLADGVIQDLARSAGREAVD